MTSRVFFLAAAIAAVIGLAGCATYGRHVEPWRDVSCFGRARVPLAEAIAIAEREQGEMVVDAEYNCAEELDCLAGIPGTYDVVFYRDGALTRMSVCPQTGRFGPPPERSAFRRLLDLDFVFAWPESEMREGAPALAAAETTMAAAIGIAEGAGGNAMAAHVLTEDGTTQYAIELVDQGDLRMVYVGLDGALRE